MTKITITQPNAFPERNQAREIIVSLIEKEYQIEIDIPGMKKGACAYVAFWKGFFEVQFNSEEHKEKIQLSDSPSVCFKDPKHKTLAEAFIQSRIECGENKYTGRDHVEWRTPCAQAIFDYLNLRMQIEDQDEVNVLIHQPGRNGNIDGSKLNLSRKDW